MNQDIRSRSFRHAPFGIEQQGASARLLRGGFRVGEEIVHSAAALQFRRPACRRHLLNRSCDERNAVQVSAGPEWEGQWECVQSDSGRARSDVGSRRSDVAFAHQRRVKPRRDEDGQSQVVALSEQWMVVGDKLVGDSGKFIVANSRLDAADVERVSQSLEMPFGAKQPPAEGAKLLGDCRAQDEAGIDD